MIFWTRVGLLVGTLGFIYVFLAAYFRSTPIYRDYYFIASIGLIILGGILEWSGFQQLQQDGGDTELRDSRNRSRIYLLLVNGRQQLAVSLICVGLICIIGLPPTYTEPIVIADEKSPPPLIRTNEPPQLVVTNDVPVEFEIPKWPSAPLNIQGINLDKRRPSIIVDSITYEVGEKLQEAEILEINSKYIVVEFHGQRLKLQLPDF